MAFHKKPIKAFEPSHEVINPRPQSLSHNIRYTKAFFSLLQQTSTQKRPSFDESDYKSFFNKSANCFNPQMAKNLTKTSFNQTKNSIHSNLFITTKMLPFFPKESLYNINEKPSMSPFENKPLTCIPKHRYQRSNFLDEKVITDNFFLPFEPSSEKFLAFKAEKNQMNSIHSSSLSLLAKAVCTPSQIKPQKIKLHLKPDEFQAFAKNIRLLPKEEKNLKTTFGKNSFKIKTSLLRPRAEQIQLSIKESIKKRLITLNGNYTKIRKTILIVEDILLDHCRHKTNLIYCYLDIPNFEDQSLEKSKDYFDLLLKEISNKFNLNARILYLYLKSGAPIKNLLEIPENEFTLIVSTSSSFKGFNNKKATVYYQFFNVVKILNQLEEHLKFYNKKMGRNIIKERTFEANIKENYKELIKNTVKLIEGKPLDVSEKNQMKFRTTEDYFDEKNAQETLHEPEKLKELDHIEKFYERTLKTIKFDKEELTDDSDEDVQTLRRRSSQNTSLIQVDNYQEKANKIARNLDVIMRKWVGKKVQVKQENNEDSEDNEEKKDFNEQIFGEREKKCKDFIEINKRRFMSKKRILEVLKKENRELFLQNIPKLMKKTSFTRSEMHSTYILYKVLQEITSQQYANYSKLNYSSSEKVLKEVF